MSYAPIMRIASSDGSFSEPDDEEMVDEMNYMAESIVQKDFQSIRNNPEKLQAQRIVKSQQPNQKSIYQNSNALGGKQINVIQELSIEFSEKSSPIRQRQLQVEDNMISDRLNMQFKAGGPEHSLDILSLKDREIIQKSLGII